MVTSPTGFVYAKRLESWRRLAEFSADRVGFKVVHGNLEIAAATFFKLESGLGPEDLRFEHRRFFGPAESTARLKSRELLAAFSHPATPVRYVPFNASIFERLESWKAELSDPLVSDLAARAGN